MWAHVDGFPEIDFARDRASGDAERAAVTVLRGNLEGIAPVGELTPASSIRFKGSRSAAQEIRRIDFFTNGSVRADQDALATLDAEVGLPDGDFLSEVALFPASGTDRVSAIGWKGAHGEQVALASDERCRER